MKGTPEVVQKCQEQTRIFEETTAQLVGKDVSLVAFLMVKYIHIRMFLLRSPSVSEMIVQNTENMLAQCHQSRNHS